MGGGGGVAGLRTHSCHGSDMYLYNIPTCVLCVSFPLTENKFWSTSLGVP